MTADEEPVIVAAGEKYIESYNKAVTEVCREGKFLV